ncbi:ABC transporter ATP-binding protein [Streptosporangium sp. NPDC051022]|uniref:ABC transporter ATP-binding protein n=1 Tax=Streptosporangium sp. NPDC051022 TaxID=3155752 RepID=UPI0034205FDD
MTEPLVQVRDLRVHFPLRRGTLTGPRPVVRAVDGVSFDVHRGETLALVGESGCGKSTTGRATLRLTEATHGSIRFDGAELTGLRGRRLRAARRRMQMVFQDPYSSLDPRMRVGAAIREPLTIHGLADGAAATARVGELLDAVGLPRAAADRYPHEFSGGQRQRIAIARAIAVEPSFLVCDEPISALDVSVQAQVVNLFEDLQERFGLTYLFIAHDLAVVRHIAHRVAVMYLGQIVETLSRDDLYERPLHPYTKSLISAVPRPNPVEERSRERIILTGDVPSPANPPTGCRFHTRCPFARDRCRTEAPPLTPATGGHEVACHYWTDLGPSAPPIDLKEHP